MQYCYAAAKWLPCSPLALYTQLEQLLPCWPRSCLLWPFKTLYLHGPKVWGGGCWEGADVVDVCAGLTGAPSSFWTDNTKQCDAVIDRRVTGLAIGSTTIVLMVSVLWVAWAYTHYCLYVSPFLRHLPKQPLLRE